MCFPCPAIVSFSNISSSQKQQAEDLGVSCFSWEEFSHLVGCQPASLLFVLKACFLSIVIFNGPSI